MSLVIAIDGPSGSGKSTVSRAVAKQLNLAYLDTGAMYRAAAVEVARHGALDQVEAMPALVEAMELVIALDPTAPVVYLDGEDISELIRSPDVSAKVSRVSTVPGVRQVMIALQQAVIGRERTPAGWAQGRGVVAEGRDITTVVAPDAEARLLLTASPKTRLARRAAEVHGAASGAALAATADAVHRRDRDDSTVAEFLQPAPGVVLVDSTELSLEQTIAQVLALVAS
ncbi:MAG: (d)CMP kinase [Micrococcales bacterium]|nr:(d)CMP kinase [Micrococcales bacterium]